MAGSAEVPPLHHSTTGHEATCQIQVLPQDTPSPLHNSPPCKEMWRGRGVCGVSALVSQTGKMVFNLIEVGAFGKSERDQKEDFIDVYDFEVVFVDPFLPESKRVGKKSSGSHDFSAL